MGSEGSGVGRYAGEACEGSCGIVEWTLGARTCGSGCSMAFIRPLK